MILSIDDLHVSFRTSHETVQALRGVSFSMHKGERVAIVGESGSGKSTLARAILRLLPSETSSIPRGSISWNGQNLLTLPEHDLRKIRGREIGMVFQDPLTFLNPTMPIGVQIDEAVRHRSPFLSRHERKAKTLALMKQVQIPDAEHRYTDYPHTLSGGLRQRVLIAMACEAPLLIADEPTTSLDVTLQAAILSLFEELETTILFITHDLSLVARLAHRVIVMYAGQIVEDAPADELFHHPRHPYTQLLLEASWGPKQ
jgi:ABC-type dipeptide/oligopeptide/nickel transport system ATPase component